VHDEAMDFKPLDSVFVVGVAAAIKNIYKTLLSA
jgi:hypothetical protein